MPFFGVDKEESMGIVLRVTSTESRQRRFPNVSVKVGRGRSQAHCVARSGTGAGCSLDDNSKSLASSLLVTMARCSFA